MKLVAFIFCFSSLTGMQKELESAIRDASVNKVQQLLQELHTATATTALKPVDLLHLQEISQKLLEETSQEKDSLCNIRVCKRFLLGLANFSAATFTTGYYFTQSLQGKPTTVFEFFSALITSSLLLGNGVEHIRLGIKNSDSHNRYARHFIINDLLGNAQLCNQELL